jgi:hypothetical protein
MLGWDAAGGASPWRTAGRGSPACRMRSGNGTHPGRRVAAAADWDPRYGDRTQLLAFTAQDLDPGGIWELLDSCLLTGEELAVGEAGWKARGPREAGEDT